jgi:hypothetical protein
VPEPCSARILPYAEWPRLEASGRAEWTVDVAARAGGGALVLVGADHSSDPAHPQFARIDRAWDALHPNAAFYEGPDRPIAETAAATIETTGESGYVRFRARHDAIEILRLEPEPRDEAAYILARHPADQAFLFYILREVVRLRDRKGMKPDAARAAVEGMLAHASALGLGDKAPSFDAFEAAYRRHLGDPADWRDVPAWWFGPLPRPDEKFTNRINRDSSEFRNRHMFDVLSAAVHAGKRVFAVVGKHHVAMLAPALRCELAH